MAVDGGYERDVLHRMNEKYTWGALKNVQNNSALGINANKCLYEGVIVPTALYGAEAWGLGSAERRKETKCSFDEVFGNLVGTSRMD